MTEQSRRRDALNLLNIIQAASSAQDVEEASGFLTVAVDPDSGRRTNVGPYSDPVVALIAAERWQAELNRGMPASETPFIVTVELLLPPQ